MKKIVLSIIAFISAFILIACANDTNDYIRFSKGDNLTNVRGRIYLTTQLDDNEITWESSDNDIIDITNINRVVVNRPEVGGKEVSVKLIATLNNKTKTFLLTVIPLTGNKIEDEYPSLSKNHKIKEIDFEELINLLTTKERSLIYLGFPECPYCQEYLPYFDSKTKALNYEGYILYFNISEVRQIVEVNGEKQLDERFLQIVNLLGSDHVVDNNGLPWLYAPTFIGLGDYEVKGVFTGSILETDEHPAHNASIGELSNEQAITLNDYLGSLILEVVDCNC